MLYFASVIQEIMLAMWFTKVQCHMGFGKVCGRSSIPVLITRKIHFVFIEKNPRLSGPVRFKPMLLFKGQLYVLWINVKIMYSSEFLWFSLYILFM